MFQNSGQLVAFALVGAFLSIGIHPEARAEDNGAKGIFGVAPIFAPKNGKMEPGYKFIFAGEGEERCNDYGDCGVWRGRAELGKSDKSKVWELSGQFNSSNSPASVVLSTKADTHTNRTAFEIGGRPAENTAVLATGAYLVERSTGARGMEFGPALRMNRSVNDVFDVAAVVRGGLLVKFVEDGTAGKLVQTGYGKSMHVGGGTQIKLGERAGILAEAGYTATSRRMLGPTGETTKHGIRGFEASVGATIGWAD